MKSTKKAAHRRRKLSGFDGGRDRIRYAHGGFINRLENVSYIIIRKDGTCEGPFRCSNLTLDAGRNAARQQLHNKAYALATTVAKYVAVSTDTATVVAGDTTLASEETQNGLQRAEATYSSLGGTGAWQLQITMTYTGSPQKTLAKTAVFDDASAGNMYYAALYSPVAVVNDGDAIQTTWQGTCQAA